MEVTGTLISYYFYCHRRLWLHANGIQLEANSEDVAVGRLIEETSYQERSNKYQQIEIGPIKIDFFNVKNNKIHEVKKSSKFHETHVWQIKYYIYILDLSGIENVEGVLDYPKEKKSENVYLSEGDKQRLHELIACIKKIIHSNKCPSVIYENRCKNCAYFDFCYSGESNIE